MKLQSTLFSLIFSIALVGCGREVSGPTLDPVGVVGEDGAVVHGRAVAEISSGDVHSLASLFQKLWMATAFAATGSTTVTYTNVASTDFAIDVSALTPGSISNDVLSLGQVSLSDLKDNDLRVCGTNGKTKCTKAAIRVYTSGSVSGFVNTADGYGVPVYTGTLNPATPVGLTASGAVQVQNLTIAGNKNRLLVSDFSSPTYAVTADFSNAGAGAYSMTYVVEYILLP